MSLQRNHNVVDIDVISLDKTGPEIALGVDHRSGIVCGLGVSNDWRVAVRTCCNDVISRNGWTPTYGSPAAMRFDGEFDRDLATSVARSSGSDACFRDDCPDTDFVSGNLASALRRWQECSDFPLLQLHSDAVARAMIKNNWLPPWLTPSPKETTPASCGDVPVSGDTGPRLIRRRLFEGRSIEIRNLTYVDERLITVADRIGGDGYVCVLVFPDPNAPVWVMPFCRRPFPLFKEWQPTCTIHMPDLTKHGLVAYH